MNIDEIRISLKSSGIRPGDTLLIHGDSVVAAQLTEIPVERRLFILFKEINVLTFKLYFLAISESVSPLEII